MGNDVFSGIDTFSGNDPFGGDAGSIFEDPGSVFQDNGAPAFESSGSVFDNAGSIFDEPTPYDKQVEEQRRIEQSLPWWYHVVNFVVSGLDPLNYIASASRAAVFDAFFRKPGEPSELKRILTLENFLRAAPLGDRPDEAVPGVEFAKRLGVPEGFGQSLAGFFIEVGLDPVNWITFGGEGLARTAAARASKITLEKLGKRVITSSDMLKAAAELEKIGDPDAAALMRYAAMRSTGEKLISPVKWVPEPTRKAMSKAIINVMDAIPTPFTREMVVAEGTTKVPMSLAELLLTPGSYARGVAKGAQEEAARKLFGDADVVQLASNNLDAFDASKLQYASGLGNYIAAKGLLLAKNVSKSFKEATGLSPTDAPDLYEIWNKTIADWLDNLNADIDPALSPLITGQKPTKELAEKAVKSSRWRRKAYGRIVSYAKRVGADPDKLWQAAENLAREHYLYAAEIGYHLSGMDRYLEAVNKVAKQIGAQPEDIRAVLNKRALGIQLDNSEWSILRKAEKLLKPMDLFQSIDPVEYVRNLQKGYYRKVLGLHLDDPEVMRRIMQGVSDGVRWYPAQDIDATGLYNIVKEKFGDNVAGKLYNFILSYGDGAISLNQLSRYTGVPEDVLVDAMKELEVREIGPNFRDVIEGALVHKSDKRPAFGLVGRRLFKERTLPKEFEADFLPISGLAERTAALASSARRAITGQEVISSVYDELARAGAIWNEPANWVRMTAEDGTKLFRVPDIPSLYGPLAGKYIPRYAANTFLRAIETGDPHWYQKALANLRVGWLANPATISRNISGGFLMMNAAGMSAKEIAQNGLEALKYLKEINANGDLSILGPGSEALNLFGEGTLAGEASERVSRALEDILGSIGRGQSKDAAKKIKQFGADFFTGRPLFNLFQYSEDAMRLTTFLAVRKRLLQRLGKNLSEEELSKVNQIAATISNNMLFDYSSQPEMVRILKRTGLMMFPSFTVFNLSRTARIALNNPAALANIQHITNASYGFLPEDERKKASLAVGVSWMRDEQPMFVGKDADGSYRVVALRNLFPRIASLDMTQTAYEPLTGGILQGIIDATVAWSSGEGKGPFSSRYGMRVFEVGAPKPIQEAQTGLFLYRKYSPGWQRTLIDALDHSLRRLRSETPDLVFKATGKTYARSPDTLFIRTAGIPYYKTSVGRYASTLNAIQERYDKIANQIIREIRTASLARDRYRVNVLNKRLRDLREQMIEEMKRALEGKR